MKKSMYIQLINDRITLISSIDDLLEYMENDFDKSSVISYYYSNKLINEMNRIKNDMINELININKKGVKNGKTNAI